MNSHSLDRLHGWRSPAFAVLYIASCILTSKAVVINPGKNAALLCDSSKLHSKLPVPHNFTEMVKRKFAEYLDYGCLTSANAAGHSRNKGWGLSEADKAKSIIADNFINGTTFWINEHIAVGHVMYDIILMQVMQFVKLDRIVLQRSACANPNQCSGVGTWHGWFRGYYTAIADAFQPGLPVHIRWGSRDWAANPIYLTGNKSSVALAHLTGNESSSVTAHEKGSAVVHEKGTFVPLKAAPPIYLKPVMCFEKVIRRVCLNCFFDGIAPEVVVRFKRAAYSLVTTKTLAHDFPAGRPVVIQLGYRGPDASRHIENTDFLINSLSRAFPSPKYDFRYKNTSDPNLTFEDQMSMVAEADVVIAEHGAFQSNLIYMRNSSLFIEWRGIYKHKEFYFFENIAQIFGVHYAYVLTEGLNYHAKDSFNITTEEVQQAVEFVRQYTDHASACRPRTT